MRFLSGLIIFTILMLSLACAESRPATPVETFKAYTKAIKEKDTTTMKLLLSQETIKMHEQEAKAQGVTLDEVVKRETLFKQDQKTVKFRNEKIDGDKATLEVENSFGSWETVPFVKEDGNWRIDKKGYANQMIQEIEQRQNDVFNQGRIQ
ncbi:MAG: DUF2950 family protein [Pyrinomonadaceae bacterium]|nr:DUF2950 family protein [Pyrinomonadaceae bacterium]